MLLMTILLVVGARPNFMKIAPIYHAFRRRPAAHSISVKLIHTGQHYGAMSDEFFLELGLPEPDVNLQVGSASHAEQTARVMMAFEPVCASLKPDWVLVVGDVNSTIACALTAKKMGIRVAHVEAGLRSRDMAMPEEINRLCTDVISDALLTTDEWADRNLAAEGIAPERIRCVGNTMIDTLLSHLDRAKALPLPGGVAEGQYGVVTLHRPSNVDQPETLEPLLDLILRLAAQLPIVFPMHPRTRKNLASFGLLERVEQQPNLLVIEPLNYLAFIGLVARSRMVLTDSGGIQEETTVLGIPCITMRDSTERPITCEIGTNILAGTQPANIEAAAQDVLAGRVRKGQVPALWDGHAGDRIVDYFLAAATA